MNNFIFCIDKLEMHFIGQISDFQLTSALQLKESSKKLRNYQMPNHYSRHFELIHANFGRVGFVGTHSKKLCDSNILRVKLINDVFYHHNVFKSTLEHLINCPQIKYSNTQLLEVALDTEENLVEKFAPYYEKLCRGELRIKGNKRLPLHQPYQDGTEEYSIKNNFIFYNKSAAAITQKKNYQIDYLKVFDLTDTVYRAEFRLQKSKAFKKLDLHLDINQLTDQCYLAQIFNKIAAANLVLISTETKNATRAKYREPFIQMPIPECNPSFPLLPYKPTRNKDTSKKYWINQANKILAINPEIKLQDAVTYMAEAFLS